MDHTSWRRLKKRKAFEVGKWVSVEMHEVELPDGTVIPDWPWVKTPDYVNVVPVTPDGEILVFRQIKYAFDHPSLAPVGGYIEPGEEPLETARRELMEEMGCQAGEWVHLCSAWVDPNRGVAVGHLFLALDVTKVAERDADDLEDQELLQLSVAETAAALDRCEFKVIAWTLNVALALRELERRGYGR